VVGVVTATRDVIGELVVVGGVAAGGAPRCSKPVPVAITDTPMASTMPDTSPTRAARTHQRRFGRFA
jgi:hypothetical protein